MRATAVLRSGACTISFGQEWIVVKANLEPLGDPTVPNAPRGLGESRAGARGRWTAGKPREESSAVIRHSIACPVKENLLVGERQRLPRRDAELPVNEVEPGHQLGDRMLDLDARVSSPGKKNSPSCQRNSQVPAPL